VRVGRQKQFLERARQRFELDGRIGVAQIALRQEAARLAEESSFLMRQV
jgi:hypothetical protein